MMILKPSKIFDNCIIQPKTQAISNEFEDVEKNDDGDLETSNELVALTETSDISENNRQSETEAQPEPEPEPEIEPTEDVLTSVHTETFETSTASPSGLTEIDFTLDNLSSEDTVQLKNRTDVYYEMYREARRKAKEARNLALSAYLEAKRIKNTYMIDDTKDSDESDLEDEDMEFDEDIE